MTLSTGAKVGIGIGVAVGLIALGLLIWFVVWPAIANAIGKGKQYTYNGGGSGSNNYIRNWIDKHMLNCDSIDTGDKDSECLMKDGNEVCGVSTGFAQLITQDGLYILSYNEKGDIYLSNIKDQKSGNIWYLCFGNKNAPEGESYGYQYSGALTAANQACNGGKNMCKLFWECDSNKGAKPCSQVSPYDNNGNYPPNIVKLDTGCSVSTKHNTCTFKTYPDSCTSTDSERLPCMMGGGNQYVEQMVYVNSDDTFSTLPAYSNSHSNDNCDDVACMAHTNYLGVDVTNYHISPTLVSNLGVRFNIVDCDATQDPTTKLWSCSPSS